LGIRQSAILIGRSPGMLNVHIDNVLFESTRLMQITRPASSSNFDRNADHRTFKIMEMTRRNCACAVRWKLFRFSLLV